MLTFREVTSDDAELILNWRTKKRVTQFMITDIEYNLNDQRKWLESCFSKPSYYHWIILVSDAPIGLINLCDFDLTKATTTWGFYIGEDDYLGVGGFVPFHFYNFCFHQLNLKRIYVEVFYNNTSVIRFHQLNGYRFIPKKDRVIEKNGSQILLVAMVLQRDNYDFVRFRKFNSFFPTSKWMHSPLFNA